MEKKKQKFGTPAPLPDGLPLHLNGGKTVPTVLINRSLDDYIWVGDDGNWSSQRALEDITAPSVLLRLVVQAIVVENPSSGKSLEDRVENAMRALLGVKGKGGRRNLSSDIPVLQRMAGEYLQGFYGFKVPHSSLSALADWALRAEPGFTGGNEEWRENRRRTVTRKFQRGQDQLLAEFTSAHDPEVQRILARVRAALKALSILGIACQVSNDEQDKTV